MLAILSKKKLIGKIVGLRELIEVLSLRLSKQAGAKGILGAT